MLLCPNGGWWFELGAERIIAKPARAAKQMSGRRLVGLATLSSDADARFDLADARDQAQQLRVARPLAMRHGVAVGEQASQLLSVQTCAPRRDRAEPRAVHVRRQAAVT